MAELLPCPFCGGEARRYYGNTDCYGITCKKCSCKIYGYAKKAYTKAKEFSERAENARLYGY